MKQYITICLTFVSILGSTYLFAQPSNDNCSGAINLTPSQVCSPTSGDLGGSTKSTLTPTNNFYDVWYSFTAATNIHYITVKGDGNYKPGIEVFSGACGTLTLKGKYTNTSTSIAATVSGLTVGQKYYYRVYHDQTSTYPSITSFETCVENFILNDDCAGAEVITPGLPGDLCAVKSTKNPGATQSMTGCSGTSEDDVWYKFQATSTTHFIQVDGSVSFDAVVQLFSGACGGTTSLICTNATLADGVESIKQTGLTVGNWYYIRVYDNGSTATATPYFGICVTTPPSNDDCANAIEIKPGITCTPEFGDGTYASQSTPATGGKGNANDDLWYKFVADTTVAYINVQPSFDYNPIVELYSACGTPITGVNALYDDASYNTGMFGSAKASGLTKGTTYYYRVYDALGPVNPLTMSFTTCVVNPVKNDECSKATKVTVGYVCKEVEGDGTFASQSFPATGGKGNANDDVWYTFKATSTSHDITVNASLTYNPIVQLYANCTTPATGGSALYDDATFPVGASGTAKVNGLTVGQDYYYRVYDQASTNPATMTFTTCVTAAPINDDCANATTVFASNTCDEISGDGKYATTSPEANCSGGPGSNEDDVWYKFTATATKHFISVTPDDSEYNPIVQVFDACGTTHTPVYCEDVLYKIGQFGTGMVTGLTPGNTYHYRVYDKSSTKQDTMTFKTCVVTATVNDDCAGAIDITPNSTCTPIQGDGTYTTQSLAAGACGTDAKDDSWFKFKATQTTHFISVTPNDKNYDPVVEVFIACPSSPTPVLKCEDTKYPSGKFGTNALTGLTIGNTYYYRVYDEDASIEDTMTFATCVVTTTPNDDCSGAFTVTPGSSCTEVTADGTYTTQSFLQCTGSAGAANDDVWFKFTATTSKEFITVNAPTGYNPVVEVYSNCTTPILPAICNDASYPTDGFGTASIPTVSGTTYYYRVYDKNVTSTYPMEFTTCVVHAPVNDDCAGAITVTATSTCNEATGDGTYATKSAGTSTTCGGNDGDDVWYKFVATAATQYIYVTASTNYDPVVQLYSTCSATPTPFPAVATSCNDLRYPKGASGSNSFTGLAIGTTYYYRVYDASNTNPSPLTFTTCVTTPPTPPINDEPCKAISVTAGTNCTYTTYSNESATNSSITAPSCDNYLGGDVWFKTVVPFSGEITIDTKEMAMLNGGMATYKGTCASLIPLSCDGSTSGNNMPQINHKGLTPGDTIFIRIWEYENNNNGTFGLCITKPTEAPLVGPCSNLSYGSGTTSWFGTTGSVSELKTTDPTPKYTPTAQNTTAGAMFTVMNTGTDPICGFPAIPNGYTSSIRLGDGTVTGKKGASLEQYFNVTKTNSNFIYNYAVVFQAEKDPNSSNHHDPYQQPFFKAEVFDDEGKQISCGDYTVGAFSEPGFLISPTSSLVTYKPWTKVSIDLSKYVGKSVHVRFTTGDCSQGGHYGYAYITSNCAPFEIVKPAKVCIGDTAKLYGPKGAQSYVWKDPSGVVVSIKDSLIFKTTVAGKFKYTCDVTMFGTSLCESTLETEIEVGPTPTLTITHPDPVCSPNTVDITQSAIVAGSTANLVYTYWQNNPPTIPLTTQTALTTSGTYYIKGVKTPTCLDIQPVNVVINPLPVIANKTATICSVNAFTTSPTNTLPDIVPLGTQYTWTVVDNPNVTGESNQATKQNSISQTLTNTSNTAQNVVYTVTPIAGTCPGATFTITVTVNPKPIISNKTETACSGTIYNLSPTNGSGDIVPVGTTYTWTVIDNTNVTGDVNQGIAQNSISSVSQLVNTTNVKQDVTYTITPLSGTCPGAAFTAIVSVNPTPKIPDFTKSICTGTSFDATPINTLPTTVVPVGTTYTWATPTISPAASISGSSIQSAASTISQALTNTTNANATAIYAITANTNTTPVCSVTFNATITVEPQKQPVITCGVSSVNSIAFDWTNIPSATSYSFVYKVGAGGTLSTPATLTSGTTTKAITGLVAGSTVYFTLSPVGVLCPQDATKICSNCIQPTISNMTSPINYEVCVGESITLKASEIPSNNNQWTITDATKVSGSVLSPKDQFKVTGLTTGTTDVNFKNDAGCVNAVPITVISAPIVTVNNPTVCNNENATITASVQPTGSYNYTWTVPAGATNPGNVASFDTKIAGNYTVQVSELNANKLLVCNTDFEENQVTTSFVILNQSSINCWKTTATDGNIEVWYNGYLSVPSFSGKQFIELNAYLASTIYQEFTAIPNEKVSISFAHRGRSGMDEMKVEIGPIGGPYTNLGNYKDGATSWGYYTVPYTFPATISSNYVLRFTAVTSAGGVSMGNFLDAISIKTKPACQIQPATSTLTVNPLPIANAGPDGTINCVSNINGVTLGESNNTSYTYSWTPTIGLSDPTLSNPIANPTNNETYTVTKTDKVTGCFDTDDVTVTINKPTVTAVAGNDGTITCVSNITGVAIGDVNNASYSYSWSPSLGLSSSTSSNPTANPITTTTYAVTSTDISSGCNNTDNVTITVNKPTVIVTAGNDAQITCVVNPNGLTIGDVNNVNYTYAWLPIIGLSDATISNPLANPSTTTTYSVTATETTSGCKSSDNIIITYNKPTLSTTAGSDATITCIANTSGVTIGGANNSAYSYAWTPTTNLSSSTVSNPTASPSTTTTYTLTTTETATGCTNVDDVLISVNKPTIISVAGNDGTITCVSNTSGVTIGDVSNPAYTYAWSPTNGLSNGTQSNPTATPIATTTYTLTTTDVATGCFGTDDVTITINKPTVIADAGADGTITCTANVSGVTIGESSNAAFTYAWTPTTTISDATSANPIANPTSNQTYTVTKTDNATGCFDTDDVSISVNKPIIPVNAGTDATITCVSNTSGVSIGEINDAAFSYAWSPSTDLNNANSSNPIANPTSTKTFTLTKTEIATGCTGTDNVVITIDKPTITAVAGNDGIITCVSNTTGIAIGDATNAAYTYTWSPANGLSSGIQSNPTATPIVTTTYTITTTDIATGCFGTDNVTITVNKPTVISDAGADGTITCTANVSGVTIGESSNAAFTYAWTPSTTISVASSANPIANPTSNQTYTVTKTDIATGCFDTDDVTITVNKPIIPVNAGTDATITCVSNTSGVSIGEINDAAFSYVWSPSTDLNNSNSSNPTANPTSTKTFTLTKTDITTGCTGTDNVVITIDKPTITAVAGNDGTITCVSNTTGIAIGDATNAAYTYAWSPTTGLSNGTQSSPTATPIATTNYTLTTTDIATGCFGTDNVTITINKPTVIADAGADGTITCIANVSGVTIGESSNAVFTYAWTPSTTISDASSANPIANPTSNQTYTVTKTDISSGCFDTDDVIISVNKPVVPVNAGTDAMITCVTNTGGVIIGENNNANYTYSWTPSTDLTNANSSTPTATPTLTTTYTLTKTENTTGCIGVDDVIITFNKPIITAVAGNDSPITCVTINSGVTIGGANNSSYSYTWTPTDGLSLTNISNPTANPTATTTYTVTTTDISSGCFSNDDVIISVDKLIPTADAGNDDFVSCLTGTAPLEGINSSGGLTYSWTTNAISAQIGNSTVQTTTTNKDGIYTLTVTNPTNGCSSSDQVTISLHTYPTLNPSSNSPICENEDLNLMSNASANVIYQWSGPNGFVSSIQNPVITTSTPNATGIYTLTVTDPDGCATTKTVTTTVNTLPTLNATNSGPICIDATSFSVNETLGNGVSWNWTSNGNATINGVTLKNPSITNAIDGEIFTLTLTDINGCVNTDNTTIKINKLPVVTAINSGPICADVSTFNLDEIGGEAISWKWTKSAGGKFSNSLQKNTIFTSPSNNETFTVQGTDINGCISTATTTIIVNPLPQFTVSDNKPCDSTTLLLTTNYTNAKSYFWNGPNGYNAIVQNPIINIADIVKFEGNYSLKVTDNNDCSNTVNHLVDIIAKDNIQFNIDTAMCQHDGSKLLKANFNGTWSGDGIANPISGLFSPNYTTTKYMPSKNIVVFQSEGAPCPNKRAVIINVYKNPSVDFIGNTELCVDDTLSLINLSSPLKASFEWNFGNEVMSKDTNALYVYAKGGTYSLTLKASIHGCDSSITKTDYVRVVDKPTNLQFTQSTNEIDVYLPEVSFATNTEAVYYHWSFGDGKSSMTQNPTHRYEPEPGNYLVRLTASNLLNHCSNYIEHIVVMPEPAIYYIPNTFTPNGDEFNNTFQPVFTMGYDPQSYSFFIFNRWGELIFESHDSKIGWDGTYGDNLVQNDTYIWKLQFKEKSKDIEHNETGHVNVLR